MTPYQPNASQTMAGRVQIATADNIAAGDTIGSTGAPLVVPANLAGGGGGGGAPTSASYVTLSSDGTLTAERVLTGTTNQITITDNGANSTVVLSTPQNIHTGASPQFAGIKVGTLTGIIKGTSGTLGAATPGVDYENPLTFSTGLNRAIDTITVADNTTTQKVVVSKDGSTVGTRKQINLIEGTNVSLTVADNAGSDSVDVTITSTAAGGATLTEVEVDFGTKPTTDAQFTITDASVSGTSKITVTPSGNTATGRVAGDNQWDSVMYSALAATGNFILYAVCSTGSLVGKRKVYYSIA